MRTARHRFNPRWTAATLMGLVMLCAAAATTGCAGAPIGPFTTPEMATLGAPGAVLVTPPATLRTSETGTRTVFAVRLSRAPLFDVHVAVTSSLPSEGRVAPSDVVFTPSNWRTARLVTVTGIDDATRDGDVAYQISFAVTSSDAAFTATPPAPLALVNEDDDAPGIVLVDANSLETTEQGSEAHFAVRLASPPASNVVLDVASMVTSEGVVGTKTVTFTHTNWNVPQSVRIWGVDDDIDDGDRTYEITVAVARASSDATYTNVVTQRARVTNLEGTPRRGVANLF